MKLSEIKIGKTYTDGKTERKVTWKGEYVRSLAYETKTGQFGEAWQIDFARWAKSEVKP